MGSGPFEALWEIAYKRRPIPEDDGYCGPDSMSWVIHSSVSSFIGGLRALMMQAAHPLVMAGVDQHSDFRNDPWARLHNTVNWVLLSTFADRATVDVAAARVRKIHPHVHGVEPVTGKSYCAADQDLLRWVHCTETDSYLTAYETFVRRLDPADADRYVAERVAAANVLDLVDEVPDNVADLRGYLAAMEPELLLTPPAIEVRELVLRSPLPPGLRTIGGVPGAGAVITLPPVFRSLYRVDWSAKRDRRAYRLNRLATKAYWFAPYFLPYRRAARKGVRRRARRAAAA